MEMGLLGDTVNWTGDILGGLNLISFQGEDLFPVRRNTLEMIAPSNFLALERSPIHCVNIVLPVASVPDLTKDSFAPSLLATEAVV